MVKPHKHCPICGTPIPLNELVCSNKCEKVWNQRITQQKRSRMLLFAVIIIFLAIWFVLNFLK